MKINEQTKIASLLKHSPEVLECIVALSPDFKKLRNPLLRKLMAGRTSIAMASKIGKCSPQDFFKALAPLGFEYKRNADVAAPATAPQKTEMPDALKKIAQENYVYLDVRALLAEGTDPLKLIQQKVNALSSNEVLVVINNFEPVPLIKLLERQGFKAFILHKSEEHIETYFYKDSSSSFLSATPEITQTESASSKEHQDWETLLAQFDNKLQSIDVRHLEMPQPMMTILEALEHLPEQHALYVRHKRVPVFLLTELKDRGFDFRIKEMPNTEVYLLIFKN